jgi:UDP-glucose:(heptosyl)LPS alpha-1,3-glucosyltransferase
MKIGIVIRRLNTRGGTERRTSELIKGLLAAGHEIHLFAESWEEDLVRELQCHKIFTFKLTRWLKILSFAASAADAVKKVPLDIIHSQARTYADDLATLGGGCHADYLDHLLADMPPARQRRERRQLFNKVTLSLERAQYRRCARLILNSHLAKAGLLRHYPAAEAKCRVIHNGVDGDFFQPNEAMRQLWRTKLNLSEGVVFGFVGSGFERKGLGEFLRALALAQKQNPGRRLLGLVVGNGDIPAYQAQAEALGIGAQVVFTGAATDTRPYYCAADVFVLPTRFDPYANTTNEALASGLPVITTRGNGASERVIPEVGYVIDHTGDIETMAAAMGELLDNGWRREMGRRAREVALQHPWSEVTRQTIAVYEEILAERAQS